MEFLLSLPLLSIHVTVVITTLLLVVTADMHGLLWILGKIQTLPKKRMEFFHRAVWGGLTVVICTGLLMFSTYSTYLLSLPAFRIKILLIAMLVINAIFIGKHMNKATQQTFTSLPKKEKVVLLVSGVISTIGWFGAFIAAQFLS